MKPTLRGVVIGLGTAALLAGGLAAAGSCRAVRRQLVVAFSDDYVAAAPRGRPPTPAVSWDGPDARRPRVAVTLEPVAWGLEQPTDIQFPPGRSDLMFVLEKTGAIRVLEPGAGAGEPWLKLEVLTASEQGLLGLAFHPRFVENGRFYLNLVTRDAADEHDVTRVEEWAIPAGADPRASKPSRRRVLLEVRQPYQNHNAGQLAFGPDGKLYVGLGDGGWRADPGGHGQNPGTLLGSMLRLDVDGPDLVPADNPFVGRPGHRPEVWAYGLRNPWRYAFSPDGRLVVGDVGQDRWEEITVVGRGENHGWNRREAAHCFPPDTKCSARGLVDPVHEYGRDEGASVTGGVFYGGAAIPALRGRYVFGDFVSGRLWAFELPPPGQKVDTVYALGRWRLTPSTFGRDAAGEVYVADFARGIVYRLAPKAAE